MPLGAGASTKLGLIAPEILNAVLRLDRVAVSADVVFCVDRGGDLYEEAIDDAHQFVCVAESGMGDAWLVHLTDGLVWFFDHDEVGCDDCTVELGIGFREFLAVADLWEQFESAAPQDALDVEFLELLASVEPNLPTVWPYRLF